MVLLTTETQRAQRKFFCPIGSPAYSAGQASDRANREPARRVGLQAKRGEKIAALRQAKELSPEAEALFPGRRLPDREKSPSSVISVPLW
jgi:hypothetical protein